MKKRKDSGVDLPTTSREPTKTTSHIRTIELPGAEILVVRAIGHPFRLRGDPKPIGLEVDDKDLFADYAREQWAGNIVRQGLYLFDRYVIPDFAFQVVSVTPEEAIVTRETQVQLEVQEKSSVIPGHKINLNDVIGHEPIKKKAKLILRYLADPQLFGEWAPRAVLFHGKPGTGKTLTARALAHEADAKILLAKASDLIGVHVGDGGRRIGMLFDEARKDAPSIIFIDELDAIGLSRSFQSIRGDVSEVVTALLGELDRTNDESGIVVIGATNALLLIDPAIRSRFDSVFEFKLPNDKDRLDILQMYASRMPIPIDFDLSTIVPLTKGLSGRDLRDRVLKEALHEAISENKSHISRKMVTQIIGKLSRKYTPDYAI
ncbi:MAG: AAA family ATPase [Candidatus Thorarchaeota archaeon]